MDITLFNKLHTEGVISNASLEKIEAASGKQLFSLHWELKTILYLGVLLLSSGIGILIYKNIDGIGHTAILLFIGLICAGSFYYCFKKKATLFFTKNSIAQCIFRLHFITCLLNLYQLYRVHPVSIPRVW